MSQSSNDDSDKKETAKFYSNWMKNKQDNWDEVCLQWCKQQKAARKDEADPNCSMLCFQSPTIESSTEAKSWNPLEGYSIVVVQGKEECSTHVDGMKYTESINETTPSKYKIDLGNIFNEATEGAKYVFEKKVVPMYNSTVEQASELSKSQEATEIIAFVKQKTNVLYNQIFPSSNTNTSSTPKRE